jgi:hypothetical protein
MALNVYEGYSKNASCALNLISTFELLKIMLAFDDNGSSINRDDKSR